MIRKAKIFYQPYFLSGILIVITLIITAQNLLLDANTFQTTGTGYTHYNNYLIFKHSFFHLTENKDLYQLYPAEHFDHYKYSPAFALLMAPLAVLPNPAGLLIWNLVNVLILFFALWNLPGQSDKRRLFMVVFIMIELITSIQNSQSNGLMAGLILFAFIFLEKKQIVAASLCIALTISIKIFGLVAFSLFLFYPGRLKAVAWSLIWIIILAILPLLVIPVSQLFFLYQSWLHLLQQDQSLSYGLSVAGWLHSWFGIEAKNIILLTGIVLFCLPLMKYKYFSELKFRLFFLSSILIWIVIFNYKAESPTFIIAITGVAVWFSSQKIKFENLVLLVLAFFLTILSPTDLFPAIIRDKYLEPWLLKVVPCILVWGKITADLLLYEKQEERKHPDAVNA
ncbi:MAG TPA: glycosyltransferase family 87 protein [Bacteroidales bacterium]|nr:glycosyltransferase family 87 protein [Bacteroidales bacterium]